MSAQPWIQALRKLIKRDPTSEDIDGMFREITETGSDRGAVLISSAFVQNMLESVLQVYMVRPLSSKEMEGLSGALGVISSFSAQIRIGHAFGIIDLAIRQDLDRIREIRNVFAHSTTPVSFSTPAIAAATEGFTAPFDEDGAPPWPVTEPKGRYLNAAGRLVTALGTGVLRHPQFPHPLITYHLRQNAAPAPSSDEQR